MLATAAPSFWTSKAKESGADATAAGATAAANTAELKAARDEAAKAKKEAEEARAEAKQAKENALDQRRAGTPDQGPANGEQANEGNQAISKKVECISFQCL
mgnify:CR=1 FL=1